jgi:hypothetical protein
MARTPARPSGGIRQISSEDEIEHTVEHVVGNLSIENSLPTQTAIEDSKKMLRGEMTAEAAIAHLKKQHGLD